MAKILIVEDDGLIAFDLACVIKAAMNADVVIAPSVAQANRLLEQSIDFVFLDIDVLDGTTFELARKLDELEIPFSFASGSSRTILPDDLNGSPFVPKPCRSVEVVGILSKGLTR